MAIAVAEPAFRPLTCTAQRKGKPLTRIIRHARPSWPPGIVVACACTECAPRIGSPPEIAPGAHLVIIHEHHVPARSGWLDRPGNGPGEPDNIACVHYHEANIVQE